MSLILFYIPVPSQEVGRELAAKAVSSSQAACANLLGPLHSLYEWEGEVREETEWLLLLKTAPERAEALSSDLEEWHPYECPAILRLDAESNPAFAAWVAMSR